MHEKFNKSRTFLCSWISTVIPIKSLPKTIAMITIQKYNIGKQVFCIFKFKRSEAHFLHLFPNLSVTLLIYTQMLFAIQFYNLFTNLCECKRPHKLFEMPHLLDHVLCCNVCNSSVKMFCAFTYLFYQSQVSALFWKNILIVLFKCDSWSNPSW